MGLRLGIWLVAGLLLTGCTGDAARQELADAARRFVLADPAAACEELAPATREALEQHSATSCVEALGKMELPAAGVVREVEVAGGSGQVKFNEQVLFLARFPQGWLVTAAGCRRPNPDPDPAIPYDCEVEA